MFDYNITGNMFQTKLTYGMICYLYNNVDVTWEFEGFQTKLTYGMICYGAFKTTIYRFYLCFKLS